MKDFRLGLKQYLRHFMVGFIIVGVMLAVFLFIYIRKGICNILTKRTKVFC